MKKLSIILACALVALASCTKSKEVHPEIGDGNDEIVTVGMKDVHVKYAQTDHAELNRVVFHYCPADANGNAQQFETAEMIKRETLFELILNDLLSDTLYWYYYELFPNGGNVSNSPQKTFRTQAFDQPEPPTPPTPPSSAPEGAINGLFTINENGDQVYFSQGNLQYQASTNTWRFAEHQWDYVGGVDELGQIHDGMVIENGVPCNNSVISANYDGWIDLFEWGTSGYNHGAVCYQPWAHGSSLYDYYAYGDSTNNLNDQTGEADWGYNAISNGGNLENMWRTLTGDEWTYVLFTRSTTFGIRFAKAQINGINGLILLPDDWNSGTYNLSSPNTHDAYYDSNIISMSDWTTKFEANGAIFLLAAYSRNHNVLVNSGIGSLYGGISGNYWTATRKDWEFTFRLDFSDFDIGMFGSHPLLGLYVRLVQDVR